MRRFRLSRSASTPFGGVALGAAALALTLTLAACGSQLDPNDVVGAGGSVGQGGTVGGEGTTGGEFVDGGSTGGDTGSSSPLLHNVKKNTGKKSPLIIVLRFNTVDISLLFFLNTAVGRESTAVFRFMIIVRFWFNVR